ncbi:MAG TPA: AbrB/MazE/SpoVT family DNA-binding domain-containing protein [Candidatus Rifleibacterium sp.]|nr:AbrB/MazE/SpoVT family DNA-binding domain-containing protein [Candidatus Rifleibacterium sp.]HPT48218.1 AbrB/MazE/SpoVT family DNA-binding domain-containing protein [Candidatus Rifleibacterium sp.]
MLKKIIQHGNSAALILDKPLLELLKLEIGSSVEITTDGRSLILSPTSQESAESDVLCSLKKINCNYGQTLKKLGE